MCQSVCFERRRVLRPHGRGRSVGHARHCPWVPRPVRAAMAPPVGDGSRLGRRGGPSSVTTVSWARGRRARGSWWGDSNSRPPPEVVPGGGGVGRSDLWFLSPRGDRSCPLHSATCRLRVYPLCTGGLRTRPVADASGARCFTTREVRRLITPPVAVVPGWAARTELGHQWARARRPARPRWWQGSW